MARVEVGPADAGGGPGVDNDRPRPELGDLLSQPEALERRLRRDFRNYARPAPGGLVLRFEDMQQLTQSFAQELKVAPGIFGEMSQMFWRFDFAGYGMLDEEKGIKLCLAMLRKYRDAMDPPKPGVVRLGGCIAYRNVQDRYAIQKKLGEGSQGAVFLARDANNRQVVVKMYDKSNPNHAVEDITREFELLMKIKHPLIAHVFEIFQDQANIYVVQEPYLGGDLTTAVCKAVEAGVNVNESWLGFVMMQVLKGVAFLHSNDIMHCDLKEPNVMITGVTNWHRPQVVVIDFGMANEFTTQSHPGGTPGYMPPEVWEDGLWTPKGDVFSIGVMIFSMRTGRSPFVEGCRTLQEVQLKTKTLLPQMMVGSQEVQTLVNAMLDKSFHSRPPIAVILEDPFFTCTRDEEERVDDTVLSALAKRQEETELKRAVLADLAAHQNLAQLKELNELFLELDADNDGIVAAEDVRASLAGKWPEERIETLVKSLMGNGGELNYEEFMGKLIAATAPAENELLWRVFSEADQSGKGFLDLDDLKALLERPAVAKILGDRDPADLLSDLSQDGSKQVSFNDFKLAMQGRKRNVEVDQGIVYFHARKMHGWKVGTELEYYSQTLGMWITCKITGIDTVRGGVQLDCKPGYWILGAELQTRVRKPKVSTYDRIVSVINPLNWIPCSCVVGR